MKLLHTSDWHLGKSLFEFSLQDEQEQFLRHFIRLAEEHKPGGILLAGDIYDRPVPPTWAVQLYDWFLSQAVSRMGIPVLAVAGNHDSASRLEFGSSLYRAGGYYIRGRVGPEPDFITLTDTHGPVHICLLPYLHPADVRALLEDSEIKTFHSAWHALLERYTAGMNPQERHVAVAHGFFSDLGEKEEERKALITSDSEINIGGIDIADSACFAPFDYAALGHLHRGQWIQQDKIRYSGSPYPYSLSEEGGKKSAVLVTLEEKGRAECQLLPVPPLRDMRSVRGTLEQLLEPAYHENTCFEDYVFAHIEGPEAPYPMEKLRTLFPSLLGLRFVDSGTGGSPALAAVTGHGPRLSAGELFRRFYREVKGEEIPPESLALVEELLAEINAEEETQ